MSCACDVMDYLLCDRKVDNDEIIDIAFDMISECLTNMEDYKNVSQMEDMFVYIHNKTLIVLGEVEECR